MIYDVPALLDELEYSYRSHGSNATIRCPTPEHFDANPSASIHLESGLWKCFACEATGTIQDFVRHQEVARPESLLMRHCGSPAAGMESATRPSKPGLVAGWMPHAPDDFRPSPSPVSAEYEYTTRDGRNVLRVSLWHDRHGKRCFAQRHWVDDPALHGGGMWMRRRPSGLVPLYRLPEVVAAVASGEDVWLVEGEKDADALREHGVIATTTSGGAGAWDGPNGTDLTPLGGANVVVVADRDHGPGIRHALGLKRALERLRASVKVVGAKVGKDAADHLHNGYGVDAFVECPCQFRIEDPEIAPPRPESRIPTHLPDGLVIDFRSVPVNPDEWLPGLQGLVVQGEFTMLAGDGGAGKSTTVAGWISSLSCRGIKVLYLAERSLKGTRKKLQAAGANFDNVLTFDPRQFADIRQGVEHIEAVVVEKGIGLLVLDPVNHFLPLGTDGHKDTSFSQAIRRLLDLSATEGLTVLGLHHLNKDEKADPIRRLMGGAGYVNKPAHVVVLGKYPVDPKKRALAIIKTNADSGLFDGSLIFDLDHVEIEIEKHCFTVATSTQTGHDPNCTAEDALRPQAKSRTGSSNARSAEEELLDAVWVPTDPDSAQDEDWYSKELEARAGVRLDPKNVGKLLTHLYEDGFNYHAAKSGKGGYKKRYWRSPDQDSPTPMSEDEASSLDDDIDRLLGDE